MLGPAVKRFDTIFIMFPGNPGCIEFYQEFLETCAGQCNASIGWLGVSFAGHSYRGLAGTRCFTLEEQVKHLSDFLQLVHETHPDARIVLAGHSIGSWLVLRVLENADSQNIPVAKAILLFPTITNLALSDQGLKVKKWTQPGIRFLGTWCFGLLGYFLPLFLKRAVVRTFAKHPPEVARDYHRVAPQFMSYPLTHNVLYLANHEMVEVLDLTSSMRDTIQRHEKDVCFLYADYDHWVASGVPEDMQQQFPAATHYRDKQGVPHAFCIAHSQVVAAVVSKWMQ